MSECVCVIICILSLFVYVGLNEKRGDWYVFVMRVYVVMFAYICMRNVYDFFTYFYVSPHSMHAVRVLFIYACLHVIFCISALYMTFHLLSYI